MAKQKPAEGYDESGEPIVKGVVAATGSAVANKDGFGPQLEAAQIAATEACHAQGIFDPEAIRAAKTEAHKTTLAALEAKAAEKRAADQAAMEAMGNEPVPEAVEAVPFEEPAKPDEE